MSTEISGESFDLFRISRAQRVVNISRNTITKYIREGLPSYKASADGGRFISKSELDLFIRGRGTATQGE